MNMGQGFTLSLSNIRTHKLRAILTTLGVIIGVAAVISVVALGTSFQSRFIQSFSDLFAPDEFSVRIGTIRTGVGPSGFFSAPTPVFTARDIKAISILEHVRAAYGFGFVRLDVPEGARYRGKTLVAPFGIQVSAIEPDSLRSGLYRAGRAFTAQDEAVLGFAVAQLVAKELGSEDTAGTLGEIIYLKLEGDTEYRPFRIVGILKDIPFAGFLLSNSIFIDIEHYDVEREVPGGGNSIVYYGVTVRAKSIEDFEKAKKEVLNYLESNSDAKKFLDRDRADLKFITFSLEDFVEFLQTQTGQFTVFVAGIGSISLVVGSIGIANIMLVNVVERTKEIGVMRATGARRRDILQVFLMEAAFVGVIGAIVGVLAGIVMAYSLTQVGPFASLQMPLVFDLQWIPIAAGIGAGVGILSGLYPAWKAARVNPVEALRYE